MADLDNMFAGVKKVSKKPKKSVACVYPAPTAHQKLTLPPRFDELDIPQEPSSSPAGGSRANGAKADLEVPEASKLQDAVRPEETKADLTLPESAELDFSDLVCSTLHSAPLYGADHAGSAEKEEEEDQNRARLG